MSQARKLHDRAMAIANEAYLLRLKGHEEEARAQSLAAMRLEAEAAAAISPPDLEPSRSVLFRSAATLALDAGELSEAQRLAHLGLGGHPPAEIAEELQAILRRSQDERAAYELSSDELILKIDGPSVVGPGFAREKDFLIRLKTLESMVKRTADRISGRAFSEGGPQPKEISQELEIFIGPAKAASYSLSVRFGRQASIPGTGLAQRVVDEVMSALEDVDHSDDKDLQKRIPDPTYRRNFLALVRQLQPDGRGVQRVALSSKRQERVRIVEMTRRTPEDDSKPLRDESGAKDHPEKRTRKLQGELLWASSLRRPVVKVRDEEGVTHPIHVPEELAMRDFLIPLYERTVEVSVDVSTTRSGNEKLVLRGIQAVD